MGNLYRYHVAAGSTREQMQFVCLVCCRMATDGHLLSKKHTTNYMDDDWFRHGIVKYLGEEMVEIRMASAKLWDETNGVGPYVVDWTLSPDPELQKFGGKFEHELL